MKIETLGALPKTFDLSVFRRSGYGKNELFSGLDTKRKKHSYNWGERRHPENWANQRRIDYLDGMFNYPNDAGDLTIYNDAFATELAQQFIKNLDIDGSIPAAFGTVQQIKNQVSHVAGYSFKIYSGQRGDRGPWLTLTVDINGVHQQIQGKSAKKISGYHLSKTMWALERLKVDLDLADKKEKLMDPVINITQEQVKQSLQPVSDFHNRAQLRRTLESCKGIFDQAQVSVHNLTSNLMPKKGGLKRRVREQATNLLWLDMIEKNRQILVSLGKAVNGKLVGLNQPVFKGWPQVLGPEFMGFTSCVFYHNIFSLFPQDSNQSGAYTNGILENRLPDILRSWKQVEEVLGEKKPEIRKRLAELFTGFIDFHEERLGGEVAAQAKELLKSFIAS